MTPTKDHQNNYSLEIKLRLFLTMLPVTECTTSFTIYIADIRIYFFVFLSFFSFVSIALNLAEKSQKHIKNKNKMLALTNSSGVPKRF